MAWSNVITHTNDCGTPQSQQEDACMKYIPLALVSLAFLQSCPWVESHTGVFVSIINRGFCGFHKENRWRLLGQDHPGFSNNHFKTIFIWIMYRIKTSIFTSYFYMKGYS